MPIINYPFVKVNVFSSKKPLVPIKITNPENRLDYYSFGIIDTGADSTSIPEFIAKNLYHKIRGSKVKRDFSWGIGGDVEVFMHTFVIDILYSDSIGNIDSENIIIKMPKKLYPVVPNLPIIILGQDDFLKDYILTIDYLKQAFSVKAP